MSHEDARVRELTLDVWYLAAKSEPNPPAPHPCWHSPFVFTGPMTPDERRLRIVMAGKLWLTNYDFGFQSQLWITDLEVGETWAFRRVPAPGPYRAVIGPLSAFVLAGARRVFQDSIEALETDDAALLAHFGELAS